ncbi:hypothetical protein KJF94_07825 [Pseudomonas hormoni]|uniref:Uncharacterized protein n=1 Tax=Pseudomonas hormoni TaxID=3093767 RepID=A0ABX8F4K1_9PSED|nr:hypothetical protein [Pseudomonas hormoni]QVW25463.1 hypothetical protein KJF94_07825 [Pseudomonas hormoni]
MFNHLGAGFDHQAALFVALFTPALCVMANRLDAQEVAQSIRQNTLLQR